MPTPLDELRQLVGGTRPPPPIATLIGFTLTAVSPGEAVIALAASRQHANPMGALHGGVLCDIADAAMGIAYASTLAEGETFATMGFVECDITDDQDSLVARASSTCMTLHGEQAHGR